MRFAPLSLLFLLLSLLPAGLNAKVNPTSDMTLNVVVTDAAGRPVAGLTRKEFTVGVDAKAQPILSFQADPGPQQVLFVLDDVNLGLQGMISARLQLTDYLSHAGRELPLPASILIFTDTSANLSGSPTTDGATLAAELKDAKIPLRAIGRSAGANGASDRLNRSLKTLTNLLTYEAARPGRKRVIWISAGWPYLSGPGNHDSDQQRHGLFAYAVRLSQRLEEARVTLYAVNPYGAGGADAMVNLYYRTYLKPLTRVRDAGIGNLALQVQAVHSGGLVRGGSNDLKAEIESCLRDARGSYRLVIPETVAGEVLEYHSVHVALDKPGLSARAAAGYYTGPLNASSGLNRKVRRTRK